MLGGIEHRTRGTPRFDEFGIDVQPIADLQLPPHSHGHHEDVLSGSRLKGSKMPVLTVSPFSHQEDAGVGRISRGPEIPVTEAQTGTALPQYGDPDPDYREHIRVLALMLYPENPNGRMAYEVGNGPEVLYNAVNLRYENRGPRFDERDVSKYASPFENFDANEDYNNRLARGFLSANLVWYFIYATDAKLRTMEHWQMWMMFRGHRIDSQYHIPKAPTASPEGQQADETATAVQADEAPVVDKPATAVPKGKLAEVQTSMRARTERLPEERSALTTIRQHYLPVAHLWASAFTLDGLRSPFFPDQGNLIPFAERSEGYFRILQHHDLYGSLYKGFVADLAWHIEFEGIKKAEAVTPTPIRRAPKELAPAGFSQEYQEFTKWLNPPS